MFKPKKSEESGQPANRIKLPLETGIRSLSGIKDLLAQAQARRGYQIELCWNTDNTGQTFVLDVQWDLNSPDPVWSLYEENDGQSKQLWSQAFAPEAVEMLYDVLVMSCGGVAPPQQDLAEILKVQLAAKDEQSKSDSHKAATPKNEETEKENAQKPSGNEQAGGLASAFKNQRSAGNHPAVTLGSSSANSSNNSSTSTNPSSSPNPLPADNPLPTQSPAQPVSPTPNMAFQMPGFGVPIAMPGIPYPIVYPQQITPENVGQPMVPPVMPWPYAQPSASNATPHTTNSPGNLFSQMSAAVGGSQSVSSGLSSLPVDAALIDKSSDISLVDLLVRADLVTEPALRAAQKIQDLIQEGKLPAEEAAEILKKYHTKGEAIEDCIDLSIVRASADSKSKSANKGKSKSVSKEITAAFELLQKAGLLTKEDIQMAENVSKKYGGDPVSTLKAAQKLDGKTMEAALICVNMLKEDLMKIEQCVITINYCSRSRVSFDEALEELGWEDPRHSKKV